MKQNKFTIASATIILWFALFAGTCDEIDNGVSVGQGGEFNQTIISGVDDGSTVTSSVDKSNKDDHSALATAEE